MKLILSALFLLGTLAAATRLPVGRIANLVGEVHVLTGTVDTRLTKAHVGKLIVYRGDSIRCAGGSSVALAVDGVIVQRFPLKSPGHWEPVDSVRTAQEKLLEDRMVRTLAKSKGAGNGYFWPAGDLPVSADRFCLISRDRSRPVKVRLVLGDKTLWEGALSPSTPGYSSKGLRTALAKSRRPGRARRYRLELPAGSAVTFTLLTADQDRALESDLAEADRHDNEFIRLLAVAEAYYRAGQFGPAASFVAQAREMDPDNPALKEILRSLKDAGFAA